MKLTQSVFSRVMSRSRSPLSGLKSRFGVLALGLVLVACSGSPDQAEPASVAQGAAQDIEVREAHMRAMAPGRRMAAIYMEIENTTAQDLLLVELSTPLAGRAEVHRTTYEDGQMRMRHVEQLSVPAGQTVEFSPGGYHVMLMDVAEAPEVGSQFDLELIFEPGQTVDVSVEVRPVN